MNYLTAHKKKKEKFFFLCWQGSTVDRFLYSKWYDD